MKKMIIDRRKSIMLVMTCIIFMMTYSSLIGTPSFSHKLSVFVNENNLSHEDIRDLIVKINQFKSRDNRRFTQELEKIGKRKEKEKNNNNLFFLFLYHLMYQIFFLLIFLTYFIIFPFSY